MEERCYGRGWQNAIFSRIYRGYSLPEPYPNSRNHKSHEDHEEEKGAKSIMETQEKDQKAVVDKSSDSGCGGLTRSFGQTRLRREHRERPLRSKFNSVEALLRPIPTKICVHPFSSASSALKVVAPRRCVSVLDFVSYLREALCSLVVPDFGFALANLLPLTTSNR
jgi:hypothetical protein